MNTQDIPPHFHKKDRIAEEDLIPDGRHQLNAPTGWAPDGTEVVRKNGGLVRVYKRISGAWYYWDLTAA